MPPPGKKPAPANYRVDIARREWGTFLNYARDDAQGVEYGVKWLRDAIAAANADAAILDPTGQKTAAEMEVEIDVATKAAYLRSARRIWGEYASRASDMPDIASGYPLKNIRECLQKAGAQLEDLDPDNLRTATDVKAAFEAGRKRIYLNSALAAFKQLVGNTTIGYDMSSTEYRCANIREYAETSGAGLEALVAPEEKGGLKDTSVPALRQYIENRLDQERRRTALICARKLFAEFEGERPVHADQIDWALDRMFKELEFSRHAKQDFDPTGQSTAEDIDRRLAEATRRCYRRTAEREIKDFIDRPAHSEGYAVYSMDKIRKFLANAGEDLASLGMTGKYAAEILEAKFAALDPKAARCRAMSALENFEKCSVPGSVAEVVAMKRRVTDLFNLAAADFAREHSGDPKFQEKIETRIDDAFARARDFYYSFHGKVPVLKPLQFVAPGAPPARKTLRFKTPAGA